MNCPQCQTENGAGSAFCGNCGARMTAAEPAAPTGYPPPQGAGYAAPGAPTSYEAPPSYNPGQNYGADGGYDPDATRQRPAFQQGQTQQGPFQQGPTQQGPFQQGPTQQGPYQPPTGGGPQPPRQSSLPPVNFDHNRLTRVDKIVAVGSFIALISIWLPWYSISWGSSTFQDAGSASVSGTTGHGWLWLEFIVALVLLAYLGARAAWERMPFTVPVAHAPLLIAGVSLQLLLVLIAFIDIPYGSEGVGWDWGAFIALLAALAAAAPVLVPAVRSYLDSRKAAGGPRSY
jgi:hypothetical protein